jgi:multimeric flavodoxin WrbA
MPTPTELGRTRYTQVSATIRAIVERVQQIWQGLSATTVEDDLLGGPGAAIAEAVVDGQVSVAGAAQAYIAAQMAAQGGSAVAEAALVAGAFAGIAPDGGPLETLLYLPAIGVRRRLAAGMPPEEAMLGGLADMARYASTAVADTARSADQVGMTAHRGCVAYVRVVQLPACARCIVLAGQMYSYSEGFDRHPNCDCQTLPLREKEWPGVLSPQQLFAQMSEQERRRTFTAAGADAISAGADIGQVVNARRGMSQAHVHGRDLRVTSEGATRRGLYGRSRRRAGGDFASLPGQRYQRATTPRLMPEEILRIADGRDEQLGLLRRYGYIV